MTRFDRSEVLQSLHEIAEDLHAVGAIDKPTMRRFDISCLTPSEMLRLKPGGRASFDDLIDEIENVRPYSSLPRRKQSP